MRSLLVLAAGLVAPLPVSAQCFVEKLQQPPEPIGLRFGAAIDVEGDRAVVGQPLAGGALGPGAAYVLRREGTDWVHDVELEGDGAAGGCCIAPGDQFGRAVAIDGDWIAVGAPWEPLDDQGLDEGAVYLFRREGDAWVRTQRITSPAPNLQDHFGYALDLSGDVLVVGQNVNAWPAPPQEAFVFRFDGAQWRHEQTLTASAGTTPFYAFGGAVAVAGDLLLIGQYGFVDVVHAYRHDGVAWVPDGTLEPSREPTIGFGLSVALEGERALIGSFGGEHAWTFRREVAGWVEEQALTHAAAALEGGFGMQVELDGDVAYVGAPQPSGLGAGGGVSVFVFDGAAWTFQDRLQPSDGAYGDGFGNAIGAGGGAVLIGAPEHDLDVEGAGAVYARVAYEDALTAPGDEIQVSAGGAQHMRLNAGPADAGAFYFLGGGMHGICPGLVAGDVVVPIHPDAYTLHTVKHPNQPPLANSFGVLDGDGRALASFQLPAGTFAGLAGTTLHHAFVVIDPASAQARSASNALALRLVP